MTTFWNKLVILGLFFSIQKVDTVKSANHTVYKLTSPQRKIDISNKTPRTTRGCAKSDLGYVLVWFSTVKLVQMFRPRAVPI